jgi:hypothetical protein
VRRTQRVAATLGLLMLAWPCAAPAHDRPPRAPFTATLSNLTPLAYGMTLEQTAAALGVPLTFAGGSFGNEMFVAPRPGGGWFFRDDRLFLQFRKGRLTGWKGDYGRNWMWE